MKSFNNRRRKRKLEDSFNFDSAQVGWGQKSASENCRSDNRQLKEGVFNKSFDWIRSCDGFSGITVNTSEKSTNKGQSSRKCKVIPCIVSSDDEREDIDEVISWNSSESEDELIPKKKENQSKVKPRPRGTQVQRVARKSQWDKESIDNLSSGSDEMISRSNNMVSSVSSHTEQTDIGLSPLISSCPSSSQSPGTSGLKGSDWMKLMDWKKSPKKQSHEEQRDPDSAKKRRKNYLRGGFAESLFRIQGREKSCLRIWQHQSQTTNHQITTKTLKVRIEKFELLFSMQIAVCKLLECEEGGEGKSQAVMFTKQIMEDENVRKGTEIEIHAPWQELICTSDGMSVILCTNFVSVISQPASTTPELSTNKSTRVTCSLWNCPCSKDINICSNDCPATSPSMSQFTRDGLNSEQMVPTTTQTSTSSINLAETSIHTVTSTQIPILTNQTPSLRQCLENHSDQSLSFLALITRIFHWYDTRLKKSRCSLLIEDTGTMALIHLQDDWDLGNLDKSRGCLSWFTGLKVQDRITRDRDSNLFSVIDSSWTGISCQPFSEDSQSQPLFTESQHPPGFCYVLIPHAEDIFDFNIAENNHRVSTDIKQQSLINVTKEKETLRVSCTVRLLYSTNYTELTRELYITDHSLSSSDIPYQAVRIFPMNHLYPLETNLPGPVMLCTDLRLIDGDIIADEFSRMTKTDDPSDLQKLKINLPSLSINSSSKSLVQVEGYVSNINKESACSWEECDICGSDQLMVSVDNGLTTCIKCKETVTSPVARLEMEIYVTMKTLLDSVIGVNLLQSTVQSLLPLHKSDEEAYDINEVIGKTVPLLNCFIQSRKTISDNKTEFTLQQIDL